GDRTAPQVRPDAHDDTSARRRIFGPLLRADHVRVVMQLVTDKAAAEHCIPLEEGVRIWTPQSPDEGGVTGHQRKTGRCVVLEGRARVTAAQAQAETTEKQLGVCTGEGAGLEYELVSSARGQATVRGAAEKARE